MLNKRNKLAAAGISKISFSPRKPRPKKLMMEKSWNQKAEC